MANASLRVVHGPVDAKEYISGTPQALRENGAAAFDSWAALQALADNGAYYRCKYGKSPEQMTPEHNTPFNNTTHSNGHLACIHLPFDNN